MKKLGFLRSKADFCLYSRVTERIKMFYMDDLILTGDDGDTTLRAQKQLSSEFEMNDLGKSEHILGLKIKQDEDGKLRINQKQCILRVLKCFGLENCMEIST
jgi:hypothetical protein